MFVCDSQGLHVWGQQSQVVHATARSLDGPFLRKDTAIPIESHNPQAIRIRDMYYIFHIGTGDSGGEPKACNEPSDNVKGKGKVH